MVEHLGATRSERLLYRLDVGSSGVDVDEHARQRAQRMLQLLGHLVSPQSPVLARGVWEVSLVRFKPVIGADQAVLSREDEPGTTAGFGVGPHLHEVVRYVEVPGGRSMAQLALHAPDEDDVNRSTERKSGLGGGPRRRFGSASRRASSRSPCASTDRETEILQPPTRRLRLEALSIGHTGR